MRWLIMSHLIWIYTVCQLVFEVWILYYLNETLYFYLFLFGRHEFFSSALLALFKTLKPSKLAADDTVIFFTFIIFFEENKAIRGFRWNIMSNFLWKTIKDIYECCLLQLWLAFLGLWLKKLDWRNTVYGSIGFFIKCASWSLIWTILVRWF